VRVFLPAIKYSGDSWYVCHLQTERLKPQWKFGVSGLRCGSFVRHDNNLNNYNNRRNVNANNDPSNRL
jgi:hypothetical protein